MDRYDASLYGCEQPAAPQSSFTAPYSPAPNPAAARAAQSPRRKRGLGSRVVALALACSLLGGAAGAGAMWALGGADRTAGTATVQRAGRETPALQLASVDTSALKTPAEVYEQNVNATVGITTEITGVNYFGYATTAAAAGSGFVITDNGYILTNYHVVDGASAITVTTYDGTKYAAAFVGGDESNDVAVLKIDAEGLQSVVLGDSDTLRVGDTVLAIGNPLGELTFSLTSGVVSALAREITMSNGTKMTLIQTDCAINSGNSGGALFNLYGEVIGITNAKYSGSSSGTEASIDNIGFAIPMNTVWHIVSGIIENGYYAKPYLGVTVQDYVSDSKRGPEAGAELVTVVTGGPADSAGLQAGDVIVEANGAAIDSSEALVRFVSSCDAGGTAVFTLWRSGQTLTVTLTLGEKPQPQEALQIPRVNG